MPDYISVILFVGGIGILIASLFYAREVLRFRKDMRRMAVLHRRAMNASRLPSEEAQAEFAAIRREFQAMGATDGPHSSELALAGLAHNSPEDFHNKQTGERRIEYEIASSIRDVIVELQSLDLLVRGENAGNPLLHKAIEELRDEITLLRNEVSNLGR